MKNTDEVYKETLQQAKENNLQVFNDEDFESGFKEAFDLFYNTPDQKSVKWSVQEIDEVIYIFIGNTSFPLAYQPVDTLVCSTYRQRKWYIEQVMIALSNLAGFAGSQSAFKPVAKIKHCNPNTVGWDPEINPYNLPDETELYIKKTGDLK